MMGVVPVAAPPGRGPTLAEVELRFETTVFAGTAFPGCDFVDPLYVEDLLGPYTLTRAFYDANAMPVLCLVVDARYRATGYGLINMANCITGGILVYVAGMLRDHHVPLKEVFMFVAAAQVLGVGLLLMVRPLPSLLRPRFHPDAPGTPVGTTNWR